MTTKQCNECIQEKEVDQSNFYKSKMTEDGYHHTCRTCSARKTGTYDKHQWSFKALLEKEELIDVSKNDEIKRMKAAEAKARMSEQHRASTLGHKLCTCCKQELQLNKFRVDYSTYTGYKSVCKQCEKAGSSIQ